MSNSKIMIGEFQLDGIEFINEQPPTEDPLLQLNQINEALSDDKLINELSPPPSPVRPIFVDKTGNRFTMVETEEGTEMVPHESGQTKSEAEESDEQKPEYVSMSQITDEQPEEDTENETDNNKLVSDAMASNVRLDVYKDVIGKIKDPDKALEQLVSNIQDKDKVNEVLLATIENPDKIFENLISMTCISTGTISQILDGVSSPGQFLEQIISSATPELILGEVLEPLGIDKGTVNQVLDIIKNPENVLNEIMGNVDNATQAIESLTGIFTDPVDAVQNISTILDDPADFVSGISNKFGISSDFLNEISEELSKVQDIIDQASQVLNDPLGAMESAINDLLGDWSVDDDSSPAEQVTHKYTNILWKKLKALKGESFDSIQQKIEEFFCGQPCGSGFPAARMGDTDDKSDVISMGFPTVLVEGQPIARVYDIMLPSKSPILSGSETVKAGLYVARVGSKTAVPSKIAKGATTVFVGGPWIELPPPPKSSLPSSGCSQSKAIRGAAADGKPFYEDCEETINESINNMNDTNSVSNDSSSDNKSPKAFED